MPKRQPGLRKRMAHEARRITSQHRQIDALYAGLTDALQQEGADGTRQAFLGFRDALEAHFDIEERTEFPALHGLAPEADAELAALVEEHGEFREILAAIEGQLDGAQSDRAAAALDGLAVRLTRHEEREERLFALKTAG